MTARGTQRNALLAALLVTIFVAGVAVGVMADRLSGNKGMLRARVVNDVSPILDRLNLSAAQRAQAESIFTKRSPQSEALMLEMAGRLRGVSDSIDAELRKILTAEQRARLDSLRTREPSFMLKRKIVTPGGTRVDSVFGRPRDPAKAPRP